MRRAVSGLWWLATSAKQFLVFHLTSAFFSLLCESRFKCIIPRHRLSLCWLHIWRTDAAYPGENRQTVVSWQISALIYCIFQRHSLLLPSLSHIIVTLAGKEWQSWKAWLTDSCYIVSSAFLYLLLYSLYSKISVYFYLFSLSDYYASAEVSPCKPTPHLFSSMSSLMFVQAVEEFLCEVRSREQPHSAGLVSQPTAVKFLMARKFDVSRAIELFQAYKVQQCFHLWQKWDRY